MSPVRAARPDDARAIAEVRQASWRATYAAYLPPHVWDDWDVAADADRIASRFGDSSRHALVAEVDGRIQAFVMFGASRDDDLVGAAEVYAIYAHPDRWSTGLGRALLGAALEQLSIRPVTMWVLEANQRARRFYESAGFSWDGTRKPAAMPGGVELPEIRYRYDGKRSPISSMSAR